MSKRVRRITPDFLKKIVIEEAQKLRKESVEGGELTPAEKVDAEEVDASEYAGSLEKDIDHIKALKIHEKRLITKIKQIREAKDILAKRIASKV
tara:strand:- start:115 stop:396 length:282 start_codon:yes stop_codon:yes gene_type:complete